MRRDPRRSRRRGFGGPPDPAVVLGASYAWRADNAVDNGSVTTSLVPYIGPTSLPVLGTGQAIKAANANLGGRLAITCVGSGSYTAVLPTAAPAAITIATVAYLTAANEGLSALTTGGTINTGVSQLLAAGTLRARKTFVDIGATAAATPIAVVQVSVIDAAGGTNYVNSYTGSATVVAGGIAGTTFQICALDSANTFPLVGAWATTIMYSRALSAAEVRIVLTGLGARYGIAIAP